MLLVIIFVVKTRHGCHLYVKKKYLYSEWSQNVVSIGLLLGKKNKINPAYVVTSQIRSLAQCDFDCEIPLNHKWPFLNLMAILTECGRINVTKLGEGAQNGPRDPEVISTMW